MVGAAGVAPPGVQVLGADGWLAREAAHHERVDRLVAGHLARAARHEAHPVEDFLFTYYAHRPGQLRAWRPGVATLLTGDDALERAAGWRGHREVAAGPGVRGVGLDVEAFVARRGDVVRHVADLLEATAGRAPNLGCFGLHEWAMVYRAGEGGGRHPAPLRLGAAGTDAVVEGARLQCSHHDAFRFFTPDARPLNAGQPRRDDTVALEQPGCLHATMDLYKWAYKLAPAIPSELVADCFELAREVRVLDMCASPYDLRGHGYEPVAVETAAGRAEYARRQRDFAARGALLRTRLLDVCATLLSSRPGTSP